MKTLEILPLLTITATAGIAAVGAIGWVAVLAVMALLSVVLSSVHHAEVVAHRMGEPLGTLVLALAVTVIETALILSVMLAAGPQTATLPRLRAKPCSAC